MVFLLTINSFHFSFPHQISGGLDVLLNLIVISNFFFLFRRRGDLERYLSMLVYFTNLHDRRKVFQVAHESRDCTQSIWIIFAVFVLF